MVGATPLYLSLSFIIEEGLAINELKEIVKSISHEAMKANIKIVCGDTKVVEKVKEIALYKYHRHRCNY